MRRKSCASATYCQTHHRAGHTYFVLRLLGYPRLVGYDRSWSEWGNRDDLPIAR
jgi:thiosulfate/3-mercaptopyruvate sulfurtransferase